MEVEVTATEVEVTAMVRVAALAPAMVAAGQGSAAMATAVMRQPWGAVRCRPTHRRNLITRTLLRKPPSTRRVELFS